MQTQDAPKSMEFPAQNKQAPVPKAGNASGLPEGNQWRYSEFIDAVQSGKVERVRFNKEGGQLQVTSWVQCLTCESDFERCCPIC